jgi:hypothetical protein
VPDVVRLQAKLDAIEENSALEAAGEMVGVYCDPTAYTAWEDEALAERILTGTMTIDDWLLARQRGWPLEKLEALER